MTSSTRRIGRIAMLVACAAVLPGCGGQVHSPGGEASTGGSGATQADGRTPMGSAGSNRGAGGADHGGGLFATGGTPGAGGITQLCGGVRFGTDEVPIDLLILLDRSASMGDPVPGSSASTTWWQAAQTAVTRFVADPRAAGKGVGIQYFPPDGTSPRSCVADHAGPEVEVALLPGNAAAITESVGRHEPALSLAAPALDDAIAHMKERESLATAGRARAVALVTDGFSAECDPHEIPAIEPIVRAGFETSGVRTFVIGLNLGPAEKAALREVSRAGGGAGIPSLIDGGDVVDELAEALVGVRSHPPLCSYPLPLPPPDTSLDLGGVRVTYVDALVPKVGSSGDCEVNAGAGWYFDPPGDPMTIELCDATCSMLSDDKLTIHTGCPPPMPGDR